MRTLLIIGAALALYWSFRILAKSNPQFARKFARNALIAAMVVVFLALLMTGRLGWLGALLLGVLPFIRKAAYLWQWFPWLRRILNGTTTKSASASSGARVSSVSARFLVMHLNQDSGEIDGDIVEGVFQGRRLSQLSLSELLQFNAEVAADGDSIALLHAYLDRIHPQWRQQAHHQGQNAPNTPSDAQMNRAQAMDILGLSGTPTRDDVIKAHRRLMQKLHPDLGGSTYLATKVNLAKQYLLEHLPQT